jgi:hypothetical protein
MLILVGSEYCEVYKKRDWNAGCYIASTGSFWTVVVQLDPEGWIVWVGRKQRVGLEDPMAVLGSMEISGIDFDCLLHLREWMHCYHQVTIM